MATTKKWRAPHEKGTGDLLRYTNMGYDELCEYPKTITAWNGNTRVITDPYMGHGRAGNALNNSEITWVEPDTEWDATLEYVDYVRGQAAYYVVFKDEGGRCYPMGAKDFSEVIPLLVLGKVTGRWGYVKRGSEYGIQKR